MPHPMKRRAYLKILGPGKLHITNSYDNKVLSFGKGLGWYTVDLMKLKIVAESTQPKFFANVNYRDDMFDAEVWNRDEMNSGPIGWVSMYDGPREKDFRCVIVED